MRREGETKAWPDLREPAPAPARPCPAPAFAECAWRAWLFPQQVGVKALPADLGPQANVGSLRVYLREPTPFGVSVSAVSRAPPTDLRAHRLAPGRPPVLHPRIQGALLVGVKEGATLRVLRPQGLPLLMPVPEPPKELDPGEQRGLLVHDAPSEERAVWTLRFSFFMLLLGLTTESLLPCSPGAGSPAPQPSLRPMGGAHRLCPPGERGRSSQVPEPAQLRPGREGNRGVSVGPQAPLPGAPPLPLLELSTSSGEGTE